MKDQYTLTTSQWFPLPIATVFPFFADAFNLERITPDLLRFRVLTPRPIDLCAGAIIDYRLRLRGLPMRWRTEILEWDPPHRFVDSQQRGPYRSWHHAHAFEERDGGTLVADEVRYQLFGPNWLTRPMHTFVVEPDVRRIFAYRQSALARAFGVEDRTTAHPVLMSRR